MQKIMELMFPASSAKPCPIKSGLVTWILLFPVGDLSGVCREAMQYEVERLATKSLVSLVCVRERERDRETEEGVSSHGKQSNLAALPTADI